MEIKCIEDHVFLEAYDNFMTIIHVASSHQPQEKIQTRNNCNISSAEFFLFPKKMEIISKEVKEVTENLLLSFDQVVRYSHRRPEKNVFK